MRSSALLALALTCSVLSACSVSSRDFNSGEWKTGDASSRGSMVQSLIDHKTLIGKSPSEVQDLLGPPDNKEIGSFEYKVVTIARCRFWECAMGVVFDKVSGQAISVAVSN